MFRCVSKDTVCVRQLTWTSLPLDRDRVQMCLQGHSVCGTTDLDKSATRLDRDRVQMCPQGHSVCGTTDLDKSATRLDRDRVQMCPQGHSVCGTTDLDKSATRLDRDRVQMCPQGYSASKITERKSISHLFEAYCTVGNTSRDWKLGSLQLLEVLLHSTGNLQQHHPHRDNNS